MWHKFFFIPSIDRPKKMVIKSYDVAPTKWQNYYIFSLIFFSLEKIENLIFYLTFFHTNNHRF